MSQLDKAPRACPHRQGPVMALQILVTREGRWAALKKVRNCVPLLKTHREEKVHPTCIPGLPSFHGHQSLECFLEGATIF